MRPLVGYLNEVLALEVECYSIKALDEHLKSKRIDLMNVPGEFVPPDKPVRPDPPKEPKKPEKNDGLHEVSVYYRTFSNVLTIRTITAEYLLAMKLMSGRRYKNDLSDIVGILWEHQKKDKGFDLRADRKIVITKDGCSGYVPEQPSFSLLRSKKFSTISRIQSPSSPAGDAP